MQGTTTCPILGCLQTLQTAGSGGLGYRALVDNRKYAGPGRGRPCKIDTVHVVKGTLVSLGVVVSLGRICRFRGLSAWLLGDSIFRILHELWAKDRKYNLKP